MNKILLGVIATIGLPLATARAGGITIPQIQEGLWQVKVQDTSNPGNKTTLGSYKFCRNHASDQRAQDLINKMKGCSFTLDQVGSGQYVSQGRCTVNGTVIVSKATISTSYTSSHTVTDSTFTPAFFGETSDTMIQDQTYLGSCPAGVAPGTRIPN